MAGLLMAILGEGNVLDGVPYLQYGALGLCAIMVFVGFWERAKLNERMNSRERHLESAIIAKDKQLELTNVEVRRLLLNSTRAINRLAEVLEDRPCLVGDQRAKVNDDEDR